MKALTLAIYDEPWRKATADKPGIRARIYPKPHRLPRDYYPTPSRLESIMRLAWTHEFTGYEMRGKMRIAIKPWR